MVPRVSVFLLCLLLAGCSGISPLKLLGGGPNVAANVQAGKTNNQTLGATKITEQTARAEIVTQTADTNEIRGETVVVNKTGYTPWHVLALIIWTWFWYEMPAPRHIRSWIAKKWKN